MSESQSVMGKMIETETGKYIAKKLFGGLEKALKANSTTLEAEHVLASISLIEDGLLSDFFEKVSDRYLSFRTLLSRDVDVYIDEIYHPLRIKPLGNINEPVSLIDNLSFDFPKIACIVGKAGQGKTTILRKLFLNHISNESQQFPLIITLRRVDWQDSDLSPSRLVKNEFNELGITISEEACSFLLQMNRLKIFFDGYDEVETEFRRIALRIIIETYTTFNTKCIVTARPGTEVQLYGGEVQNYVLMDLNREDVIQIIESHKLIGTQDKEQLLEVVNSKKDITNILLTPIIVDIFISTYNSLVAEPTTIIDFYEQLFQTLTSSHDRLKIMFERNGQSGLTNSQLVKVFQTASFNLLNKKNDINFRDFDLVNAFNFACKKHGFDVKDTHLDVINKTSLIKQDGHDYSYLHKSIIEFYAAKHVKELSDESRKGYYQFILNNYNAAHENVLRYLSKIDSDLFYLIFVKSLIENIKEHTKIYDQNCREILTVDTFLVGASFDSIIVSKEVDNGKMSFTPQLELSQNKRKVVNYFLMFSSILDLKIPAVRVDVVKEMILNLTENDIDIISGIVPYKREANIDYYEVEIDKVINLEKDSADIISLQELSSFYDQLLELEVFIERKQESYEYKNALDQFY